MVLIVHQHGKADDEQRQNHQHVGAALRVLPVVFQRAKAPGQKVQRKVDARDQHEQDADCFDQRTVVVADTGVVGREAANGDGREAVADGVEQIHAGGPVGQGTGDGQAGVDVPEHLGGFGDPRGELVFLQRARHLGAVQLHAAHAQHRQNGHRQYDDPHAAKPLQLLAVIQQRARQGIQPGDHRGPGGGQPGKGLEHRVGDGQVGHLQQPQRHGTEQAENQPEQNGDQVAVTGAQLRPLAAHRQPDAGAGDHGDDKGAEEGVHRLLVVVQANGCGRQHAGGKKHQQDADDALYLRILHSGAP